MTALTTAPNGQPGSWGWRMGNEQQWQGILPAPSARGYLLLITLMDDREGRGGDGFFLAFPHIKLLAFQDLPLARRSIQFEPVSSWNMK